MTLISARDARRRSHAAAAGTGAALLLAACTLTPPEAGEGGGLTDAETDAQARQKSPETTEAKAAADEQRRELEEARDINADARLDAQELRRQLDELQAEQTDRGLMLTLGDMLFVSGAAELSAAGTRRLGKLTGFLSQHPENFAVIEGHTDNTGSSEYNQRLSQRRADAVKSYLVGQGIGATRLTALGKGASSPVAANSSAAGRQNNRRVEVIIQSTQVSAR